MGSSKSQTVKERRPERDDFEALDQKVMWMQGSLKSQVRRTGRNNEFGNGGPAAAVWFHDPGHCAFSVL